MIANQPHVPKPKFQFPPLQNGDHLDQKIFHERYEAMPPDTRAELIGGIVYFSGRRTATEGRMHVKLCGWLSAYEDETTGLVAKLAVKKA